MRQINEQRRQRVQVLSGRLAEIEKQTCNLLVQLEDLAAKAAAVRSEYNTLLNLDAPTSDLPDEVLALIFEIGTRSNWESARDFQVLVSHVSHRWRAIALATAQLWASIRYIGTTGSIPPRSTGEVLAYLSRSRLSPLDISFQAEDSQNMDLALIQSIMQHMGHCSWHSEREHRNSPANFGNYLPPTGTLSCPVDTEAPAMAHTVWSNNSTRCPASESRRPRKMAPT